MAFANNQMVQDTNQRRRTVYGQHGNSVPEYDAPAPAPAPVAPAPLAPAPAPAAPRISSAQTGQKGVEDMWFQFLNSNGYAKGPGQQPGFYQGGAAHRGRLDPIVQQFNQQTGLNARVDAEDRIDFGQGARDVIQAGTDNWWLSGPLGQGGAGGGAGVGGGAGAGGGAAGGVNAFQQQIRDLLMQQLGQLSQPVSADDPSIKGEMDAQGALLERVRRDRRAAAAERAAATGQLSGGASSGGFESEVASGFEDKGQALSGIQAQLFGREIQSRRDKVAQLLSLATQSGDAEASRSLQLQLAQMDDQLRRLGIAEQGRQFDDSFGLDAARFRYGQDRDSFLYGAGGY